MEVCQERACESKRVWERFFLCIEHAFDGWPLPSSQ